MLQRDMLNDETYMRLAVQLASAARGQTETNPVVGCVLTKQGRVVGFGSHMRRGSAHAEVVALDMAGSEAAGSTAYVTLEPCSHYGRTPPCCDRLIREGVKRVVVACQDPNPQVAGSGIERLRAHGIQVDVGLLEDEALALNEAFNTYIVHRRPFVTFKTATTLDGKIAAHTGDSRWVSGPAARELVHTLRHRHQAIMVGIGTVLADDPSLTTRLSVDALNPIRLIVDSRLRLPAEAKVVADGLAPTWVLTTEQAPEAKAEALTELGVQVIRSGAGDQVDLELAMRLLGEREIGSILLEGGGTLAGSMLEAGLIDKCVWFVAPKLIGGANAPGALQFAGFDRMADAVRLERVRSESVGDDLCVIGYPRYERKER